MSENLEVLKIQIRFPQLVDDFFYFIFVHSEDDGIRTRRQPGLNRFAQPLAYILMVGHQGVEPCVTPRYKLGPVTGLVVPHLLRLPDLDVINLQVT